MLGPLGPYTDHPTQPGFPPPTISLASDLKTLPPLPPLPTENDLKESKKLAQTLYWESPMDPNMWYPPFPGTDYPFMTSSLNLRLIASGKGWSLDIDPYNFNNLPPISLVTLRNVNELKSQRIVFEPSNQGYVQFKDAEEIVNTLPIRILRIKDGCSIDGYGFHFVAQKAHFEYTRVDYYWCLFKSDALADGPLDPFSKNFCGLIEDVGHGQISIDLDWKSLLPRGVIPE
jgi:hypothetical protein